MCACKPSLTRPGYYTTHDSISNYHPKPLTEAERRFRTVAVHVPVHGRTDVDLNEMVNTNTPAELGRLGFKAVAGPGRYGRSDERRDVRDEALEGDNADHSDSCQCDLCRADRAAATKDGRNYAIVVLNRRNRRAFGRK